MVDLSPAARAIRDAVLGTYAPSVPRDALLWMLERPSTVATLRALADHQQAPVALDQPIDHWSPDDRTRRELRNLADELEGRP